MVYDPSGKSRIVIGVLPRTSPFTITSAFAGVDRINKFPRVAIDVRERDAGAPDAGRDGVGAGVDGSVVAGGCVAPAGRSTVVSATDGFVVGTVAEVGEEVRGRTKK